MTNRSGFLVLVLVFGTLLFSAGCGGGNHLASPPADAVLSSSSREESLGTDPGLRSFVADGGLVVAAPDNSNLVLPPATGDAGHTRGLDAVSAAASKIGKPYVWGAAGPNTFDCSGLTQWAYKQVGVSLKRTSADQAKQGFQVGRPVLRRGDLVFFATGNSPSTVTHVGIFEGGSVFIDANSVAVRVARDDLNNAYWKARFLFGRRVN